jgi:hypothetical protein
LQTAVKQAAQDRFGFHVGADGAGFDAASSL